MFSPRRSFITSCAILLAFTPALFAQGLDTSDLCNRCKPCEDFYKYVNSIYLQAHPIPAEYSSWGPWTELQEKNEVVLRKILDKSAEDAKKGIAVKGSNEQKVGDFYASALDSATVEHRGIDPLKMEFKRIEFIANPNDIVKEIAHLQRAGTRAAFGCGVDQDPKNSERMMVHAGQGGLGLPDRDYYFRPDKQTKKIRDTYVQYVSSMLGLAGEPHSQSAKDAETILNFETILARASMTRIERRNPDSTYHDLDIASLDRLTPHFEWKGYLTELGAGAAGDVNVGQPKFFIVFDSLLVNTPLDTWKAYLRWHLINGTTGLLPHSFVDTAFQFSKLLRGANELSARWKRAVSSTDRNLGEALGQEYVKVAFPPEAKRQMQDMISNLKLALKNDLSHVTWIGDTTRQRAIAKMDAFAQKIGYPDKWEDYSAVTIEPGKYFENVMAVRSFEFQRDLNKFGKPVDRTEWGMTPPTINAYYDASMNEIVFPAGILQPPFFDFSRDEAFNYGAIGTVIGHEMTHGFDDNGAKYDLHGNLKNWWSDADMKNFKARAQCIIDQFSSYTVQDSLHLIGGQVVGESIADLGGVTLAYAAFERSLQGKERRIIGGFTPEQRFFLGYARQWASNERPEAERTQVNTDPHPPGYYRVIGPLSNFPPFAKAFGCQEGDKMVRPAAERCEIW